MIADDDDHLDQTEPPAAAHGRAVYRRSPLDDLTIFLAQQHGRELAVQDRRDQQQRPEAHEAEDAVTRLARSAGR